MANIKRLDTNKKFAVLSKNLKLTRKDALARAPQGEVTYTDQQIRVGTQTVPVANASLLVSSADFDKGLNAKESLLHGWAGAASAGVTVVRATQNTTTFTGGLALARSFPSVSWLPPHDRTLFAFNESYGNTTQAGATPLETNILHASLEQDEYVSPRIFVFGSSTFDHNFSQNLQLEAALGGGAGITAIKNEKQELDLKADVHYLEENKRRSASSRPVFLRPTFGTSQNRSCFMSSAASPRRGRSSRRFPRTSTAASSCRSSRASASTSPRRRIT